MSKLSHLQGTRVELSSAPNLYSGRTKFRLGLAFIGLLSFFSLSLYTNHPLLDDSPRVGAINGGFYFLHNLLLAGFAFSMVPLADFQVFSYRSPFWSAFKSLSTYALLSETESIVEFVYSFVYRDWDKDDLEEVLIVFGLVVMAALRWILELLLFWYGCHFLRLLKQSRRLPANYYISLKANLLEYGLLHAVGYLLFVHLGYSSERTLTVLALLLTLYFTISRLYLSSLAKKRF